MKLAGFTKQERSFITLMRIWAIAFLITGLVFAIVPDYIPNYVSSIGVVLFDWHSPPPDAGQERFWVALAVSLLLTLSYMCAIIQHNVPRNIGYTRPVILSKFVSTAGYLGYFLMHGRQFMFLVGAIVDGLIFIITLYFYRSAMKSRT